MSWASEELQGAELGDVRLNRLTLELQRTPKHPAREATLEVRFAPLWLQVPVGIPQREGLRPLKVQVILASEENPPAGEKAISWLLLTTLPVEDFEQACQCLQWYSKRWLIERYHFVLKSGCRLEELQLEAADRIERALATYSIVAWRLLWLTYQARVQPDQPADQVLETHEWQALYCHTQKTTQLPEKVPTISECVGWIARLGGFLGRKRDGNPGVVTLWRGIQRLHDLAAMWQLLNPVADQVRRMEELLRLAEIGKKFENGELVKEVVQVRSQVTEVPVGTPVQARSKLTKALKEMTNEELFGANIPGSGHEKIRRAVEAIQAYNNEQGGNKEGMWAINTKTLKDLTNCRTAVVDAYLRSQEACGTLGTRLQATEDGKYKVEIGYNEQMGLSYQHNRGRGSIRDFIKLV